MLSISTFFSILQLPCMVSTSATGMYRFNFPRKRNSTCTSTCWMLQAWTQRNSLERVYRNFFKYNNETIALQRNILEWKPSDVIKRRIAAATFTFQHDSFANHFPQTQHRILGTGSTASELFSQGMKYNLKYIISLLKCIISETRLIPSQSILPMADLQIMTLWCYCLKIRLSWQLIRWVTND